MSTNQRIFVELSAPPFLAVMWMTAASLVNGSEPILLVLVAWFPMLIYAYVISFIPSLIYTLVMEVWFRSGLRTRFGLFCTAGLSSLLGAGAGFLAVTIGIRGGPLIGEDWRDYTLIGAVVGLLVGLYVGRKQTSAA